MAAIATISSDYRPGLLGRVVQMHATYYARHYGLGSLAEAKIAQDIGEFFSAWPHPDLRLWHAVKDDSIVGAIGIDGRYAAERGAQLRWFITDDSVRGMGLGRRMLRELLDFAGVRGFSSIYLWTFAGLDAARHLYESFGFRLAEQRNAATWGVETTEQRFVLELQSAAKLRAASVLSMCE